MAIAELISDALDKQPHAIGYYVSRRLRSDFPDEAILEGVSPAFNLEAYAREGLCTLADRLAPHPQRLMYWVGGSEQGNLHRAHNMWFRVSWQGERLQVLIMHWPDMQSGYHYYIVAGTHELAEAFHLDVCAWNTRQPDEYILAFDVNGWLPGLAERTTYIAQWNATLQSELRTSDEALNRIAEQTGGFSFAYLKELFLSSMMRWISAPEPGAMDRVMEEQVVVLREQMASIVEFPADPDYGFQYGGHFRHGPAHVGPFGPRGPVHHPGPEDIPL